VVTNLHVIPEGEKQFFVFINNPVAITKQQELFTHSTSLFDSESFFSEFTVDSRFSTISGLLLVGESLLQKNNDQP